MSDLISRQAAIEVVRAYDFNFPQYMERFVVELRDAMKKDLEEDIKQMPSAQPEQAEYIQDIKAVPDDRDMVCISERVTATYYDDEHEEWSQKTVTIADVLDSVCDDYTVLPSAQQWILCSERMPEDDTEVIVSCTDDSGDSEFSYTTTGWHFKGIWVVGNERSYFVRAWMPLPKPYEEVKDEAD